MKAPCSSRLRRLPRRGGAAVVEFALLLPLIMILLLGLLEVGRMVQINQILINAAREGARQASGTTGNYDAVNATITNYLKNAGIANLNNLQVQIVNMTTSDNGPHTHGSVNDYDPSKASQLDQIQVSVSLPYQNVQWVGLGVVITNNMQLNAQVLWNSNQNKSYPATVTPPSGS